MDEGGATPPTMTKTMAASGAKAVPIEPVGRPGSTGGSSRRSSGRVCIAVRATLLGFTLLGGGFVAYLIASHPPRPDSLYPKCMLHQLTGLHCPGCGTGRAAHAALNGRLVQALAFNPVAVVLLPVVAGVVLYRAGRWALGRPVGNDLWVDSRWVWLLAGSLLVFAVLRNVPVEPFTLLAPHEL